MSIKRTGRLRGYGWKTYKVEGQESIRFEYKGVELCLTTGFPDNDGNDVVSVQIVHPNNTKFEVHTDSPQRKEYTLRVPIKSASN